MTSATRMTDGTKPTGANAMDPREFKSCCADFYADDMVRRILGDSFE